MHILNTPAPPGERRNRKAWLFHSLMAPRAARVSPEHVQALNMIDLVFYGKRILGVNRRSKGNNWFWIRGRNILTI